MSAPEAVRDRWAELQDAAVLAEVRERCEAAAVEVRPVAFNWWRYWPRPFARELAGEDPRRGRGKRDAELGVDAQGRPVFQRLRDKPVQLYRWTDDVCELIEIRRDTVTKLGRFIFAGGRLVEEQFTEDHRVRLDGRQGLEIVRWHYRDDRPARVVETYESGADRSWGERGPHWRAKVYIFDYDQDGELASITDHHSTRELALGGDADAAQQDAFAAFPDDYEARPLFDGRSQRRERELPAPEDAYEGLAEPIADALHAGLVRARATLGPLEFVLVLAGGTHTQAIAADTTYVDRARRMVSEPLELLQTAFKQPRGTVAVEAVDVAPAEVLRGLRAGEQALARRFDSSRGADFQREVVAALNTRDWGDVAPTFVVLSLPARDERADSREPRAIALPELEDLLGRERVAAFVRRIATADASEGDLRPQDRAELRLLLKDAGLEHDEADRIAADALWGIVLEPGGRGRSRLGGSPVLAEGTAWPETDEGVPLTHLATIALDELPAVEGREHLPEDGLLSFFADLSEESEFVEPIEPEDEEGHDLVAIIHTPAGADTYDPEPPDEDEALDEQRVTPTARLQLRYLGFGLGEHRFDIDAVAEGAVERLTYRVNGRNSQQLLGFPQHVQDDPREPGQIVLFHIDGEGDIGFEFMDGGDIHFLGTPQDIRAGRWDRITVYPNTC